MRIDKAILHKVCEMCNMSQIVAWTHIADLICSQTKPVQFQHVNGRLLMGEGYTRDVLNHLYRIKAISVSENGDITIPNFRPVDATSDLTKETKRKTEKFVVPTLEEMLDYGQTKGGTIEVIEDAWNYYESNGWKVGKVAMKNWKAALTRWIKNNYGNNRINQTSARFTNRVNPPLSDSERASDLADLAQSILRRTNAGESI